MTPKLRVRPTRRVASVLTTFPVILDVTLLGDILRGRDSVSASIALFVVVVVPLTAVILHVWLHYYIELGDEFLRMVKYFGLGSKAIPVTELSGVRLHRGFGGWPRLQFASANQTISLMPNYGKLWPMARLAGLVSALASRGVPIDPEARTYLAIPDESASSAEERRPAPLPARWLPPFRVMAPIQWFVVFAAMSVTSYVLGNFVVGVISGALLASGTMITLYIAYRSNRWL